MVDHKDSINHNRVLWLVTQWGNGNVTQLDTVVIKDHPSCGPVLWGYSVYRRSPGFRTIGSSVEYMIAQYRYEVVELFYTEDEARHFYLSIGGDADSLDDLVATATPSLKWLKKQSNISHNFTDTI